MPDARVVIDRCCQLARFSEEADRTTRRFLTPPMMGVHQLVRHWFDQAGMSSRVDAAGNLIGRQLGSGTSKPDASPTKVLLIGSHLDTVPNAGAYDGVLGVMMGLAIAEAIRDWDLPFAVDVIGFSEEEGVRFSLPYIGSHAAAGTFQSEWLSRLDEHGVSMREAIEHFGLDADQISHAAYDPGRVIGYLEAHIEQGPVLFRDKVPVAAVQSIVGQSRLVVEFCGEAGHAGTTPMLFRHDALVGAARWIDAVHREGVRVDGLRTTVGRVECEPNASNVIPSRVILSLDVRHASDQVRLDAVRALLSAATDIASHSGLQFEVLHRSDSGSIMASETLTKQLTDAIKHCSPSSCRDGEAKLMSSGAGHDAVVMGAKFPMAMLFIRHPGVSHHSSESVEVEDVQVGLDVMLDFVKRVCHQESIQ